MTQQFHKLLLSELRMVVYQPGDAGVLTDRLLCEAVTLNENLQSLGYILKPEDLMKLAVSPSAHTFYGDVRALVPEVKAEPMYPGFPRQVMEMSEAQFRLDQMIHYFSTYGLELLFDVHVSKGWLPAYDHPVRDQKDTRLLDAKVIELVAQEDAALAVLKQLLERRERLTNPELALVLESAAVCSAQQMQGLQIRFKENLELLFPKLMEEADRDTALRTLRVICSHSGDVLRCAAAYLSRRRYHLRTSEKKLLVKLLESYSLWDFQQNLMYSNARRERNLMILRHLDYNSYSRSSAHAEAVRALRNAELQSWFGIGEAMLKERKAEALDHFAQRPGHMVRMLRRLLSLGYRKDDILEAMGSFAGSVSAHLILNTLYAMARPFDEISERFAKYRAQYISQYREKIGEWSEEYLAQSRDNSVQWCHRQYRYERKILSRESIDLRYECDKKASEERFRREMRELDLESLDKWYKEQKESCIEYAEDERRCAAWYHLEQPRMEARAQAARMVSQAKTDYEEALRQCEPLCREIWKRWPHLKPLVDRIREEDAQAEFRDLEILLRHYPWYGKVLPQLREQLGVVRDCRKVLEQEQAKADAWLEEKLRKLDAASGARYEHAMMRIAENEREQLESYELDYQRTRREAEEKLQSLPERRETERIRLEQAYLEACRKAEEDFRTIEEREARQLASIEASYQYQLKLAPGRIKELEAERDWELEKLEERKQKEIETLYMEKRVMDILTELLREHFLQVETPLKGRKVFLDPQQFDLHHSVLELADRSAEGGYIRSGIAWKIPDDAKFVRFFVYWNDPERVDLDLHAVVRDLHDGDMHVGWDGEYCINGAVHSGDITNSDAAEYVDIDLSASIREVGCNIHLYDGKEAFRDVQTCYVGMMAVDKTDQEVQHYDPANCFFTHELTLGTDNLFYGFVDVLNRCVRFVGLPNVEDWDSMPKEVKSFSLQNYLDCVLDGQQVQRVDSAEEADIVLTMGKSLCEKGISLADSNFFLEC